MDKKDNFDVDEVDPHLLAHCLLQKSIIDQRDIYDAFRYFLFKQVQSVSALYKPDQIKKSITLIDSNNKLKGSLELPSENPKYIGKWVSFSPNCIAVFDTDLPKFIGIINRLPNSGLGITPKGGVLIVNNKAYGINYWLHNEIPVGNPLNLPIDIYVGLNQHDYIFVTDRSSGKFYVITQSLSKILGEFKVRKGISKKTINVAYSFVEKCCYVTDSETPDLIVIRPGDNSIDRFYQNFGILGNLAISNDNKKLYIIVYNSNTEVNLIILKLPGFEFESQILIPGKRFSDLDDPCDLISITPNGKYLLIMTYTDTPSLFTPLISIIDTETNQLIESISLKKEEKPIGLAVFLPDVQVGTSPTFSDILLERQLIKPEELKAIIKEMKNLNNNQKIELDRDILDISLNMITNFSPEEIDSVLKPSYESLDKMIKDDKFKWQARNMSELEKRDFIQKVEDLKTEPEVSKANSVFVLNWLKNLLK